MIAINLSDLLKGGIGAREQTLGPELPLTPEAIAAQAMHIEIVHPLVARLEEAQRVMRTTTEALEAEDERWGAEMKALMPTLGTGQGFRIVDGVRYRLLLLPDNAPPAPVAESPDWVQKMIAEGEA